MSKPNQIATPEELDRRLEWYIEHPASNDIATLARPLRCPCCGCKTLSERMMYQICQVCFWEDNGQDEHNAEDVHGGPNRHLSLLDARQNYLKCGACSPDRVIYVRPPRPEEVPPATEEDK